jgi:hypothetical protein
MTIRFFIFPLLFEFCTSPLPSPFAACLHLIFPSIANFFTNERPSRTLTFLLKGHQNLKPGRIHFGDNFLPSKKIAFDLLQRLPI